MIHGAFITVPETQARAAESVCNEFGRADIAIAAGLGMSAVSIGTLASMGAFDLSINPALLYFPTYRPIPRYFVPTSKLSSILKGLGLFAIIPGSFLTMGGLFAKTYPDQSPPAEEVKRCRRKSLQTERAGTTASDSLKKALSEAQTATPPLSPVEASRALPATP